jgi:coenzyme Q-binding protein COQ10
MTEVRLQRRIPVPARHLFNIVAAVEDYRHFVPLCRDSRVWDRRMDAHGVMHCKGELTIGYDRLGIRERFACDIVADPRTFTIEATAFEGPLRHLRNRWALHPASDETMVDFALDYQLDNRLLQALLGGMFDYAAGRIMASFEERAQSLMPAPA